MSPRIAGALLLYTKRLIGFCVYLIHQDLLSFRNQLRLCLEIVFIFYFDCRCQKFRVLIIENSEMEICLFCRIQEIVKSSLIKGTI